MLHSELGDNPKDIESLLAPGESKHVCEIGRQEDGLNLIRGAEHWRASVPPRYKLREPRNISAKEHRYVELPGIAPVKSALPLDRV